MKLLAVDASTSSGSVALLDGEELVAEFTFHGGGKHSETLLTAIGTVCTMGRIDVKAVDAFAVTRGPGSFTGLRVGISVVKGLAWSSDKPVIGVSTLMSLAMNVPCTDGAVCPILNARRGEIYGGLYRWDKGCLEVVRDDCAVAPEAFMEKVDGTTLFLGDGIDVCGGLIRERFGGARLAPPYLWDIRASNVGRIALTRVTEGVGASEILPLYKRRMGASTGVS
ncbi:MAG: tRNA (adenosine(37)-N6)-threonylcarbamoyltransferase complex dimerization subunit type 1 TsaB [Thermodesulfobacteriota bacterium]